MPRPAPTHLIGKVFDRLTVTGLTDGPGRRKLILACECGNKCEADPISVTSGRTSSCGCARIKHGHAHEGHMTRTYTSWAMMSDRCRNPLNDGYALYGGRGITVCERWAIFANFLADMGERPEGTSIDRIDTNGNYEPGNCRWATQREQLINRRNTLRVQINGEEVTLAEACRNAGVDYQQARARVKRGATPTDAVRMLAAAHG